MTTITVHFNKAVDLMTTFYLKCNTMKIIIP